MRIARPLLFLCALGVVATEARADDGYRPRWYAAISGSVVYLNKAKFDSGLPEDWQSYDFGYGYAVATGVRVLPDVRWELELSGHESTVKHDSAGTTPVGTRESPGESTDIMTNAYYDFHNASQFVPYLGAGVGEAYARNARFYVSGGKDSGHLSGWALSYQFMTGLSYEFTNSLAMNLGYRYVTGRDVQGKAFGTDISFPNTSHNVEAGIRFFFN